MEKWISATRIFIGRVFSVVTGRVQVNDETDLMDREVVEHPGSVAIVPIISDKVLMVKQFRIAAGKDMLEIPAGRIDKGETPEQAARRELEEEIGFRGDLISGPVYYSSVGFLDEQVHVFLAVNLKAIPEAKPDE